jgi:hypothetical protein
MTLTTGTPLGTITEQEDLYLEGAPTLFIQDYNADPLNNPDSDGFYWGLSGTSVYNVFEVGCVTDVSLTENLTMSDVLCDNIGVKDTVQQRNYLEFVFTLVSFFPFSVFRHLIKGGTVTRTAPTEKFGLGAINNNLRYMAYCPKVYDDDVGDYVVIHLHKAKVVDAWTLNMPFGNQWTMTGLKLRAFADTSKPSTQQFASIIRADASVIT